VKHDFDQHDMAIAISGFLRPQLLIDNIHNSQSLYPNSEIFVLIDGYSGSDTRLKSLNMECKKRVKKISEISKKVKVICEPVENLGIKQVASQLISFSLSKHEYVIFLEDDIFLTKNSREEIHSACLILAEKSIFAFATLFSLFPHQCSRNNWLTTKWPRMWGLLFRRQNYIQLLDFDSSSHKDGFQLLAVPRNVSILREFERIWRWKYTKAKDSKHAFDTCLMEKLWKSTFQALTPVNSVIIDRGGDVDSFSSRGDIQKLPHRIAKRKFEEIGFCRTCEKLRFMEFSSRRLKVLSLFSSWKFL
jgi:hypothetical protein